MKQFLLLTLALLILLVAAITMTERSPLHAMHGDPQMGGTYPSASLREPPALMTSGNTAALSMMVAERTSELILAGAKGQVS